MTDCEDVPVKNLRRTSRKFECDNNSDDMHCSHAPAAIALAPSPLGCTFWLSARQSTCEHTRMLTQLLIDCNSKNQKMLTWNESTHVRGETEVAHASDVTRLLSACALMTMEGTRLASNDDELLSSCDTSSLSVNHICENTRSHIHAKTSTTQQNRLNL